ncbi:phytanoyl-CoA dioxygenase [Aureococcus anophagefferens]|nr:phytanoyl-CoA dioxygenase [Aureococcus anophagefferens]
MLADLFADLQVKRRCVYIKTSLQTAEKIISRVEKNDKYTVRARRAPPQGGLELAIDFEAADGDVDARLAELVAGADLAVPPCGGAELAAEADGADRDALALAHDCAVPLLPAFALDDATARPSRPLEALVRDLASGAPRRPRRRGSSSCATTRSRASRTSGGASRPSRRARRRGSRR